MQAKKLHVLLIEDNAADTKLTRCALSESENPIYRIDDVPSLSEAAASLKNTPYDAVLLELGLPGAAGIEAVAKFRALCPFPPPLIVLTTHDDQGVALEALDQGAQEYIVKSDIKCLSRSICHAISRQAMMAEVHATNEMLKIKNARLAALYDTAQQFVDNVSHEFRTPLTVIREYTSIIRDGCDGPVTPAQIEHLETVMHRTDDLALMIDDMLDISKLESGGLRVWRKPSQIADMINNVIDSLTTRAESKKVRLTSQLSESLPQAFCDEEKAQRALVNLAVNALKFTPEGGHVEIWARLGPDGSEIVVGVTDSGPGISPENLEVVFQRFKQLETQMRSSTKGFGLGLNIAKELIDLNLGRMHVDSELGKGSTFSFTLPCNDSTVVFQHYAQRIFSRATALPELSFISVSISDSNKHIAQFVDEFLQRSLRSHDLAIQTSDRGWILIVSCLKADVDSIISRISQEWIQEAANNPAGVNTPTLQLVHSGTWPVSAGLTQLSNKVRALLDQDVVSRPCKGTVLVVDDDPEVSTCLGLRLQLNGYTVLKARDGVEGLASTLENHPDALVVDVRMPNMDGIALLREMRTRESVKDTPVVMMAANPREEHHVMEAGARYFVAKPYEASAVLSALKSAMGER